MNNETKIIMLNRQHKHPLECLVDADDYDWLVAVGKWHSHQVAERSWYAYCSASSARKLNNLATNKAAMHRLIVRAGDGQLVDHANHNTLDNRKSNLRIATPSQNLANKFIRPSRCGYRGVWHDQRRGRFVGRIAMYGQEKYLGTFPTAIEAARAYDRAAIELHGEFAVLNFPNEYAKAG